MGACWCSSTCRGWCQLDATSHAFIPAQQHQRQAGLGRPAARAHLALPMVEPAGGWHRRDGPGAALGQPTSPKRPAVAEPSAGTCSGRHGRRSCCVMHRRRVVLQREAARRGLGGGAHAPQQRKAVQEVHSRHPIGLEWVWLAGGRAGCGCRAAVHQAAGRGRGGRAGRAEGEEVAARRCPPRRLQLCDGQQRVGAGVHEGGGHPAVACGGRRAGGWEGGCLLPAGVGGGGRRISNT